jgi:hypothetical protein
MLLSNTVLAARKELLLSIRSNHSRRLVHDDAFEDDSCELSSRVPKEVLDLQRQPTLVCLDSKHTRPANAALRGASASEIPLDAKASIMRVGVVEPTA